MNVYGFLWYVMINREGLIQKNAQTIAALTQELTSDNAYQKCLELLSKVEKKKNIIAAKMRENHDGQCDKENRVLLNYAEQIELLADAIYEKEQKMRLIKLMIEYLKKKKKINNLQLFVQFYRQNNQLALEELGEKVSIKEQLFRFICLNHAILKKLHRYELDSMQARLEHLLKDYERIQNSLHQEQEYKQRKLKQKVEQERVYPTIQKRLLNDANKVDIIFQQASDFMTKIKARRTIKEKEIQRLEEENQTYQNELKQIREMLLQAGCEYQSINPLQSNGLADCSQFIRK